MGEQYILLVSEHCQLNPPGQFDSRRICVLLPAGWEKDKNVYTNSRKTRHAAVALWWKTTSLAVLVETSKYNKIHFVFCQPLGKSPKFDHFLTVLAINGSSWINTKMSSIFFIFHQLHVLPHLRWYRERKIPVYNSTKRGSKTAKIGLEGKHKKRLKHHCLQWNLLICLHEKISFVTAIGQNTMFWADFQTDCTYCGYILKKTTRFLSDLCLNWKFIREKITEADLSEFVNIKINTLFPNFDIYDKIL